MITRWNHAKRMPIKAVAVLGGLLAALGAHPGKAAEPGLLGRCWPAEALAAREGERAPVKGAAGHKQPIPVLDNSARGVTAGANAVSGRIIRRVKLPPGKKLVALTLDLCEQAGEISGYDGAIIDYLRANRIKATVFTGGKWFMTHAERAQQLIADPLLEIGSHGWAHRNVRGLTGRALIDEIRGPEPAFQTQRAALLSSQCAAKHPKDAAVVQSRLGHYRFPFGACNPAAVAALAENGLSAIQWDVSTGDSSKGESAEAIARTLLHEVRPGSIILAHANGRGHHTAAALELAMPKLKAKGFTFVTISELIAAGQPEFAESCYDHRPGDTDRYDALFQPRPKAPETTSGKPDPASSILSR